ncbi:MAG: 1,6-anhydro-N-acetylmuramyl-L-alanine amidase AmpD [Gammaproteobacteria bacterium]|nr:1,6-anhydro-N-acetylmuramyl-L-alanine amidase AmpD [Gammaproteobacteria bacterium]
MNERERVDGEGWLAEARRAPSPYCNERPGDGRITLVVLHGVSLPPDEFGGPWVEAFFTGTLRYSAHSWFEGIRDLRVAPHLLIRRDGELVQFVSFLDRAWHAGRSSWMGREECNDYSIGIELEGNDTSPYTDAQYLALADVLPALIAAYPGILEGGVAGHADVAPGRKTDPGESFDWRRLDGMLDASGYNLPARSREQARGKQA